MSASNGHRPTNVHIGVVATTDPVEPRAGEPVAIRRMREGLALEARLKREREAERTGGPTPSSSRRSR